ncbi:hypothetical protein KCP75_25235 [Salmonella enterica subsp. enterica]|nr:hypothetical protein KCP75_25235 [Salmonella enterica subsp. enterica]
MTPAASASAIAESAFTALNIPPINSPARINANPAGVFIYLARRANPDMADYIVSLKLPGIHFA